MLRSLVLLALIPWLCPAPPAAPVRHPLAWSVDLQDPPERPPSGSRPAPQAPAPMVCHPPATPRPIPAH